MIGKWQMAKMFSSTDFFNSATMTQITNRARKDIIVVSLVDKIRDQITSSLKVLDDNVTRYIDFLR